jgi:hypothetical protein
MVWFGLWFLTPFSKIFQLYREKNTPNKKKKHKN